MSYANTALLEYPDCSYIACEDLEFGWSQEDVEQVIEWWNEGVSYDEMARRLDRDGDEVAILLIDLVRKGRIQKRRGGC